MADPKLRAGIAYACIQTSVHGDCQQQAAGNGLVCNFTHGSTEYGPTSDPAVQNGCSSGTTKVRLLSGAPAESSTLS